MLKPEQVFGCAPDYLGDLGRIVMAPELVSPKMNRIYYLVEGKLRLYVHLSFVAVSVL